MVSHTHAHCSLEATPSHACEGCGFLLIQHAMHSAGERAANMDS